METTHPKILIIDDDPFILDMYVIKFKEEGFEIDVARNGKEGVEKVHSFLPDVVLLDVVMPAMDGFDVMAQLKKDQETRPFRVIFLTNFGQKEDVERGFKLGADEYIIKAHFTPSEVVEKVHEVLNKSSLHDNK